MEKKYIRNNFMSNYFKLKLLYLYYYIYIYLIVLNKKFL